ncbi:protein of unknown function UPF0118 [Thermocrinis albus DSM 14484]|uniref:Permease n=1 Tax=Thermocrinis albus (strain DSM 14484 / JCM 11386 / HI 11/12) TaxID=638303 RepID=D3SLL3_THEAH|nr:AI-2E family transporter [Thermocrinis albus]ADC89643.1 protein of unknown function UPF0118 [Thermocrinis albus DSM 14484]
MEREKIVSYFILVLTFLFLMLVLYIIRPFIVPVLWAVVFTLALHPLNHLLRRYVKSRFLSAFLLVVLTLLLIVIPVSFLGFMLVEQTLHMVNYLVSFAQNHTYEELISLLKGHPLFSTVQQWLDYLGTQQVRDVFISGVQRVSQWLLQWISSLIGTSGVILFKSFVFLITLFFLLRDGDRFLDFAKRFLPIDPHDTDMILYTVYRTILATVYGTVGVAVLQGILSFVGYYVAGFDYAVLLGVATFFASFVPPFGTASVWFPSSVYLLLQGKMTEGISLLIYSFLVISSLDNFLRPFIMKFGVPLPYVVLFFSTLGGLAAFGFVGLFIGPMIFSTMFSLLIIYERRFLKASDKT